MLPSVKLTAKAPEHGSLEDDSLLLGQEAYFFQGRAVDGRHPSFTGFLYTPGGFLDGFLNHQRYVGFKECDHHYLPHVVQPPHLQGLVLD